MLVLERIYQQNEILFHLRNRAHLTVDFLDLPPRISDIAGIVDHVIREFHLFVHRHLRCDPRVNLRIGQCGSFLDSSSLNFRRALYHDNLVVILVRPHFDHERRLNNPNSVWIFRAYGIQKIQLTLFDCRMNETIQLLPKFGILEYQLTQHFAIDASVTGNDSRAERFGHGSIHGISGSEQSAGQQIGFNDATTQLGKHATNTALACTDAAGQSDLQHANPRRMRAALMVLLISIAMVIGPTPPGT